MLKWRLLFSDWFGFWIFLFSFSRSLRSVGVMFAMPLERLLQSGTSFDIPQHSIISFFQSRQQLSNFGQFLFRNNHNPPLSLVQHREIPRPHLHTSYLDRNVYRPRFSLWRRANRRNAFTPDSEIPLCAKLTASSDVSHSAVDDSTRYASDLEPRGDNVS
jgi:hypothetical protein